MRRKDCFRRRSAGDRTDDREGNTMQNGSRHFIAVLGTNFYTDCIYQIKEAGFACHTPFAQLAVLKYVMPKYQEGDRITILLTGRSERRNWLDREYEEQERRILEQRGIKVQPGEQKPGFQKILEQEYPDVPAECLYVCAGNDQKELEDIFEKMYGTIRPGETIYFDITHGLRNIPMQVLTVIHYAKVLKDIRVGGIYYGAYEIGEDRADGMRYVNLIDMSMCSKILDWSNAAESFIKGGSSRQIWELEASGEGVSGEERAALNSLYDLTNCLNACKGKSSDSPKKSIRKAYEQFKENYDRLCRSKTGISEAPLLRLFERIESDLDIFRQKLLFTKGGETFGLDCTATGMAAVDWAIRKNLTQLGFTALKETIVTYACERCRIPAEDRTVRNTTVWDIISDMARHQEAVRERGGSVDRKWFCEHKLMITPYRAELRKLIEEIPEELLCVTAGIMKFRDALNDFGFSENEKESDVITYTELQDRLQEFYETLKKLMKEQGVVFQDA